jgi:cytoskeletal protein CcmA (bactofilin family)
VFFRKKGKYTDVEGYNRISRLIEDRQREMTHGIADDEEFDDDSVLLDHDASREHSLKSFADEAEPVSSVRPAPAPAPDPVSATPAAESVAPAFAERRIPFSVSPSTPPASSGVSPSAGRASELFRETPAAPEAPSMPVPEFGSAPSGGSFVAAEAVWEGKLITNGQLRVEGTLHGEVQTPSSVFVAANAHLDGTIRAGSIVVAGEVEGTIECSERLEVLPGGSARGEIETATLVVHEGAFIDSRFQMRRHELARG